MKRGWIAAIVAAVTFFCIADISIGYINHGMVAGAGFFGSARTLDGSRQQFVTVSDAGRSIGLRPGDISDWRLWTPEQRSDVYFGYATAGTAFDLPFLRNGSLVYLHVFFAPEKGRTAGDILDVLMRVLLALAGIFLIARGSDRASLFAGIYVCANSVYEGFTNAYPGPAAIVVILVGANAIAGVASYGARFFFAYYLLPADAPRWLRLTLLGGLAIFALPFSAVLMSRAIMIVFGTGLLAANSTQYFMLQFSLYLFTFAAFLVAGAVAKGPNASAVRFIVAVIALAYIGPTVNFVSEILGHSYPVHGMLSLTYLALAIGLPYAVVAKRLVAVDFVVSKTLVYAIVLSIIVGIFVLAERAIEQAALGRFQSYALELLVPLALGLSFSWIERWTERIVERVLYRSKLRAEQELEALAEDFPHARDVRVLSQRVAQEVHRYMYAPFVCVYREQGSTYTPIASAGHGTALPVDCDDPVFIRLRSKHRAVATDDFATALPGHGVVVPLVVFGTVTGAIYCHYRESGERLDPDEMETLRKLAHELAIALLWVERDASNPQVPLSAPT